MRLHGGDADVEPPGYLRVRQAAGDEDEDLALAVCDAGEGGLQSPDRFRAAGELGVYKGNTAFLLADLARAIGSTAYLLDTFGGFSPEDLRGIDEGLPGHSASECGLDVISIGARGTDALWGRTSACIP